MRSFACADSADCAGCHGSILFAGSLSFVFTELCILVFKCFNPFPNKPLFLHVCRINLLKILGKKEKLLVMNNFSFFQCFLYFLKTFRHFHRIEQLSSEDCFSFEESEFSSLGNGAHIPNHVVNLEYKLFGALKNVALSV